MVILLTVKLQGGNAGPEYPASRPRSDGIPGQAARPRHASKKVR